MADARDNFDGSAIERKSRAIGGRVFVVDSPPENRVEEIRKGIERGSYEVDPKAVANAMLRRLFGDRGVAATRGSRA